MNVLYILIRKLYTSNARGEDFKKEKTVFFTNVKF